MKCDGITVPTDQMQQRNDRTTLRSGCKHVGVREHSVADGDRKSNHDSFQRVPDEGPKPRDPGLSKFMPSGKTGGRLS